MKLCWWINSLVFRTFWEAKEERRTLSTNPSTLALSRAINTTKKMALDCKMIIRQLVMKFRLWTIRRVLKNIVSCRRKMSSKKKMSMSYKRKMSRIANTLQVMDTTQLNLVFYEVFLSCFQDNMLEYIAA